MGFYRLFSSGQLTNFQNVESSDCIASSFIRFGFTVPLTYSQASANAFSVASIAATGSGFTWSWQDLVRTGFIPSIIIKTWGFWGRCRNLLAIFGASNPSKPNGRDSRGFVEKIVGKEILAQKAIILNDRRLLTGDRWTKTTRLVIY